MLIGADARDRPVSDWGRIVRRLGVCGGVYRMAGTRIPVGTITSCWRGGWDTAKIVEQFPSLTSADVQAALKFRRRDK